MISGACGPCQATLAVFGRGEAPPQEAAEAAVGLEDHDVIETVAGGGDQQDEGLELLRLGVAALALAEADRLVVTRGRPRARIVSGARGKPARLVRGGDFSRIEARGETQRRDAFWVTPTQYLQHPESGGEQLDALNLHIHLALRNVELHRQTSHLLNASLRRI
jgi:hypothetical protein